MKRELEEACKRAYQEGKLDREKERSETFPKAPEKLLIGLRDAKELCADYFPNPTQRHRALKAIAWAMAVAEHEGLV